MAKYFYSFEETGNGYEEGGDTLEETLEIANNNNEENKILVFIGEPQFFTPLIYAEAIINDLVDQVSFKLEEAEENYLECVSNEEEKDLTERLNKALGDWAKKNNRKLQLTFIVNIKSYDLCALQFIAKEDHEKLHKLNLNSLKQ